MKFFKYHGLGNDYIVINPADLTHNLTDTAIRLICNRNYGIGSDGILLGPIKSEDSDFDLRIFNPDGSEAEKSGNGLRIFSRYLWDHGLVDKNPFSIKTKGGIVRCYVENAHSVTVEMGKVSFDSEIIPVLGNKREVINEHLMIADYDLSFCAASIGNPHCIVLNNEVSKEEACFLGPKIENNKIFPNKTNVQFMKVLDRNNIQLEIWERGAGYTLASGSSSVAAAAVAKKLNFCDNEISVHMPGGVLKIVLTNDYDARMTGPVIRIAEGIIYNEIFECMD